ncbi:MAG: lactonase family protein [Roseibacillus sp.]
MSETEVARLYIGSYTQPEGHVPNGCGEGVYGYDFDLANGGLYRRGLLPDIVNPTFVHAEAATGLIYAVSETDEDGTLYAIRDEGGQLSIVSETSTKGAASCHVVRTGDMVYVASYMGGCISAHSVDGDQVGDGIVAKYEGTGPNEARQEAPHAHQVLPSPCGKWIYACDLGADRVWQHEANNFGAPIGSLQTPAGSGPRHLSFHPTLPIAYVLCELTCTLLAVSIDPASGEMAIVAEHDTVEAAPGVEPAAAGIRIHPSGKALYVSNRFSDTITVFTVGGDGSLEQEQCFPCGGKTPRDFALAPGGAWLVIGNQDSETISVFALDPNTGRVDENSLRLHECNSPACIAF